MKKYLLAACAFVVLLVGGIFVYQAQAPKPAKPAERLVVEIGHLALPQTQFIAKEKGFFDEVGLDVRLKKFSNANLAMEALARGEIQGTGSISFSTLLAFEGRSPNKMKVYEGLTEGKETGWSTLIVKKGSGITSPEQLKGKKIVMRAGLSSKSQGELVIKAMGLDMKDVEFVQVDAPLLVSTFSQPDVSAYLDVQPVGTILVQKGLGDVLIVSPRAKYVLDPFPVAGSVLNSEWIRQHPEEAKKFKMAMDKAIDYTKSHELETRAIFQKYLELEDKVAMNIPLPRFGHMEEVDPAMINRLADIEVDYHILDKKPNIDNWSWK